MGFAMMTLQEAIAKATKLLKLSESSNPHEAALAAQRAQEILTRYDIDSAALNLDASKSENNEQVEKFDGFNGKPLDQANKNISQWKGSLASTVSRANQCRAFQQGNAIGIIGRPSDVQKVRYLYDMLVREIDRLTLAHGKGMGKNWCTQFRYGVVDAIGTKLNETKAKVVADMRAENTGSALIRINEAIESIEARNKDVERYIASNMRMRSKTVQSRGNYGARQAGREAGKSININGSRGALGAGSKQIKS